jgi:hypothetical protein
MKNAPARERTGAEVITTHGHLVRVHMRSSQALRSSANDGNVKHGAPVKLAVRVGIIRGRRLGLTYALGRNPILSDALLNHVLLDGVGAALAESHVALRAAAVVRVARDNERVLLVFLHVGHNLFDFRFAFRLQHGLAEIEQDV